MRSMAAADTQTEPRRRWPTPTMDLIRMIEGFTHRIDKAKRGESKEDEQYLRAQRAIIEREIERRTQ